MKTQRYSWLWLSSVPLLVLLLACPLVPADQPAAAPEGDITVEARGPVHEAFAMPVTATPQPGIIAPKQPPDPIPEEPPDQKPQGDNVIWIPGYWAWDTDRTDFIWVSGFWRVPPPDRRWVPGYWNQVDNGWQWVSGFWAPAEQQDLNYVPEPPATLDAGPSTPATDENSNWVPGIWVWRDSRFVWRPGYWLGAQPGYIWTPASYCWTPSGYTFVSGFWDYDLADRGQLFAPVCFNRPLWQTPGWAFTPSYCVGLDGLLSSLWVRPSYGHYYFGDYYGAGYAGLGYRPWLNYGPRFHDPLYGYYRWNRGTGWLQNQQAIHAGRWNGELARPGRTLGQQNTVLRNSAIQGNTTVNNINSFNHRSLQTVTALNQAVRGNNSNVRFNSLNATQRNEQRVRAQGMQNIGRQRQQSERLAAGRANPLTHPRTTPTTSVRLPHAPQGTVHNGAVRPSHVADPGRHALQAGPAGHTAQSMPHNPGAANHPGVSPTVPHGNAPRTTAHTPVHPPTAAPRPTPTPQSQHLASRPAATQPRAPAVTAPRTPAPRVTPRAAAPAQRPAPTAARPPATFAPRTTPRPAAAPRPALTQPRAPAMAAPRPPVPQPRAAAPRPAPTVARAPAMAAPRVTPRPAAAPAPRPVARPAPRPPAPRPPAARPPARRR